MCCSRINTDVLLANLFAVSTENRASYSLGSLTKYLHFLSDSFPTYLATDFSKQTIVECVRQFPQLYRLSEEAGDFVVQAGDRIPNLDYFNANYPHNVSQYIQRVTCAYIDLIHE